MSTSQKIKHPLKYLGVKGHDVINSLEEKVCVHVRKKGGGKGNKQMWPSASFTYIYRKQCSMYCSFSCSFSVIEIISK